MSKQEKCYICNGGGTVGYWNGRCERCNGSGFTHPANHICPVCGSGIINYGGGWRCIALYCCNSTSSPIANLGREPAWWHDGTSVFRDGDAWCATRPEFVNLQESPAGFGRSPQEAVTALTALVPTT